MNKHASENAIVVMAKDWQAGPVKTRLAASVGTEVARQIYKAMAGEFWRQLQNRDWQRHLWSATTESSEQLGEWLTQYDSLSIQQGDDLGQRMLLALQSTKFNNWVAVSGTDAPDLSPDYIAKLCANLNENDICIAPTFDGGYAFMAMREVHPQLFFEIEWSSEKVLEQTIAAAKNCGLRVHLGPKMFDLDTIKDLEHFARRGYSWAQPTA
jgi:rSAM/selenodomain-associated transferase 1